MNAKAMMAAIGQTLNPGETVGIQVSVCQSRAGDTLIETYDVTHSEVRSTGKAWGRHRGTLRAEYYRRVLKPREARRECKRRGCPHLVVLPDASDPGIGDWIRANAIGGFAYVEPVWGFADPHDAVAFKMKWY